MNTLLNMQKKFLPYKLRQIKYILKYSIAGAALTCNAASLHQEETFLTPRAGAGAIPTVPIEASFVDIPLGALGSEPAEEILAANAYHSRDYRTALFYLGKLLEEATGEKKFVYLELAGNACCLLADSEFPHKDGFEKGRSSALKEAVMYFSQSFLDKEYGAKRLRKAPPNTLANAAKSAQIGENFMLGATVISTILNRDNVLLKATKDSLTIGTGYLEDGVYNFLMLGDHEAAKRLYSMHQASFNPRPYGEIAQSVANVLYIVDSADTRPKAALAFGESFSSDFKPTSMEDYVHAATSYQKSTNYFRAVELYEEMFKAYQGKSSIDVDVYRNAAHAHANCETREHYRRAGQLFKTAAEKSQDPSDYYSASEAYLKGGMFKEAAEQYECFMSKLSKLGGLLPSNYLQVAVIRAAAGDREKASEYYVQYLEAQGQAADKERLEETTRDKILESINYLSSTAQIYATKWEQSNSIGDLKFAAHLYKSYMKYAGSFAEDLHVLASARIHYLLEEYEQAADYYNKFYGKPLVVTGRSVTRTNDTLKAALANYGYYKKKGGGTLGDLNAMSYFIRYVRDEGVVEPHVAIAISEICNIQKSAKAFRLLRDVYNKHAKNYLKKLNNDTLAIFAESLYEGRDYAAATTLFTKIGPKEIKTEDLLLKAIYAASGNKKIARSFYDEYTKRLTSAGRAVYIESFEELNARLVHRMTDSALAVGGLV